MSFERRPLIAGNWKMNGLLNSIDSLAGVLVKKLNKKTIFHFDMLICPPATLLSRIADLVDQSNLLLGGQDCHIAENGAYTGDISAEMLRELGLSLIHI